jgi:hypothetical protein
MLRLVEVALFLSPFVVFAAWRFMAMEGGPSPRLLIASACLLIALIGALAWLSQREALPPNTIYEPAHLENGQLIPARTVPR